MIEITTQLGLTEQPRIKGWQPIETRPKDYSEILVWDGTDIWLVTTEYEMYPKQNGCGCCSTSVHLDATHWMPLPEPPK